ncbi:MAG: SoxR reducing system RseC family protein [Bacteroidales bacterium]|nr:SoxR reducing system RseC family protein [Bacteroidales bacterium]
MRTLGHHTTFCHKGIVQKIENKSVLVVITAHSACSGCHAAEACTMTGKEEKIIEVKGLYNVKPGDEVTIFMKQSNGYLAVLLAYVIPLVTILFSLIIFLTLKMPELTAGLLSLIMLIPYFTILYLFRNRINERFIFTLNV